LGDLEDKRVAHLMCNAGHDTVSLANLGASVTGVDISDAAIEEAQELADATDASVRFVRADIYDWFDETNASFDLAFSSYGITPWLSNLRAWAGGIHDVLAPGGHFVLVDFHPVAVTFDESMRLSYQYIGSERYEFDEGVGDYVAQSGPSLAPGGYEATEPFENPEGCIEFPWTFAEVLQALILAGLTLERVEEYAFSNGWRMFDSLVAVDDRRWGFGEGEPNLPLMFGVRARRP
jgi:SAM-dependent methyltransferase